MTKAVNLASLGTSNGTSVLVSGTAVASTSGTSIDFTGIPSWVKRITVMFAGVSTNGSSTVQIQLGTSGGVQTTGYLGTSTYFGGGLTALTTGFGVVAGMSAAVVFHGNIF